MTRAKDKRVGNNYIVSVDLMYNVLACFVEFMNLIAQQGDPHDNPNAYFLANTYTQLVLELQGVEGLAELHDHIKKLKKDWGGEDDGGN